MIHNHLNREGRRLLRAALWMLFVLPLCLAACGKEEAPDEMELCQEALGRLYPETQNLAWENYDGYTVASFYAPSFGTQMEVWFRKGGIMEMRVTDYGENTSFVPSFVEKNLTNTIYLRPDKDPAYIEGSRHVTLLKAVLYELFGDNTLQSFWRVSCVWGNGESGERLVNEKASNTLPYQRITPLSNCWNRTIWNVHP